MKKVKFKVYLAGPDVFRKDAKEHGARLKKKCDLLNLEGLFPLDNEVDMAKEDPAQAIYDGDIEMLNVSNAVMLI